MIKILTDADKHYLEKLLRDYYRSGESTQSKEKYSKLHPQVGVSDLAFQMKIYTDIEELKVHPLVKLFFIAYAHQGGFFNTLSTVLQFEFVQQLQIKFAIDDSILRFKAVDDRTLLVEEYHESHCYSELDYTAVKDVDNKIYAHDKSQPQLLFVNRSWIKLNDDNTVKIAKTEGLVYFTKHTQKELRDILSSIVDKPGINQQYIQAFHNGIIHEMRLLVDANKLSKAADFYGALNEQYRAIIIDAFRDHDDLIVELSNIPNQKNAHYRQSERIDNQRLYSVLSQLAPAQTSVGKREAGEIVLILDYYNDQDQLMSLPLNASTFIQQGIINNGLVVYPMSATLEHRHVVLALPSKENARIYMKLMPDQGVLFRGADMLSRRLFAGSTFPPNTIGKLTYEHNGKKQTCPVLLSLSVPGETLKRLSSSERNVEISKRSFERAVLLNLLLRSGDCSLSNIVVQENGDLSIVDDNFFFKPVAKTIFGSKLQLSSILLCMRKQMNEPLTDAMRQGIDLLEIDPILFGWLTDLMKYEESIKRLFTVDEAALFYQKNSDYRFSADSLIPVGAVHELRMDLFKLTQRIKSAIECGKSVTLLDITRQLQPQLAQALLVEFAKPQKSPKEHLESLLNRPLRSLSTKQSLTFSLGHVPKLNELTFYSAHAALMELVIAKRYLMNNQQLLKMHDKYELELDFATLSRGAAQSDLSREHFFLSQLKNYSFAKLSIRNSKALTSKMLAEILANSSDVSEMVIAYCPKIILSEIIDLLQPLTRLTSLYYHQAESAIETKAELTLFSKTLTQLFIRGLDGNKALNIRTHNLEKLTVIHCPDLSAITLHSEKATELDLHGCAALELRKLSITSQLKRMKLEGCDAMSIEHRALLVDFPFLFGLPLANLTTLAVGRMHLALTGALARHGFAKERLPEKVSNEIYAQLKVGLLNLKEIGEQLLTIYQEMESAAQNFDKEKERLKISRGVAYVYGPVPENIIEISRENGQHWLLEKVIDLLSQSGWINANLFEMLASSRAFYKHSSIFADFLRNCLLPSYDYNHELSKNILNAQFKDIIYGNSLTYLPNYSRALDRALHRFSGACEEGISLDPYYLEQESKNALIDLIYSKKLAQGKDFYNLGLSNLVNTKFDGTFFDSQSLFINYLFHPNNGLSKQEIEGFVKKLIDILLNRVKHCTQLKVTVSGVFDDHTIASIELLANKMPEGVSDKIKLFLENNKNGLNVKVYQHLSTVLGLRDKVESSIHSEITEIIKQVGKWDQSSLHIEKQLIDLMIAHYKGKTMTVEPLLTVFYDNKIINMTSQYLLLLKVIKKLGAYHQIGLSIFYDSVFSWAKENIAKNKTFLTMSEIYQCLQYIDHPELLTFLCEQLLAEKPQNEIEANRELVKRLFDFVASEPLLALTTILKKFQQLQTLTDEKTRIARMRPILQGIIRIPPYSLLKNQLLDVLSKEFEFCLKTSDVSHYFSVTAAMTLWSGRGKSIFSRYQLLKAEGLIKCNLEFDGICRQEELPYKGMGSYEAYHASIDHRVEGKYGHLGTTNYYKHVVNIMETFADAVHFDEVYYDSLFEFTLSNCKQTSLNEGSVNISQRGLFSSTNADKSEAIEPKTTVKHQP